MVPNLVRAQGTCTFNHSHTHTHTYLYKIQVIKPQSSRQKQFIIYHMHKSNSLLPVLWHTSLYLKGIEKKTPVQWTWKAEIGHNSWQQQKHPELYSDLLLYPTAALPETPPGPALWALDFGQSLLLHAALQQQLTSGLCNLALYHNASTFIVKVIIIFRLLQTIQNVRFRRRRVTMFLQNKTGTLQMHWQNIIWQTSDKWNKHTTTNLNFGMEKWGSGEGWGAAVRVCIRGHKKINSTRQKYLLTLIIFLQVCTKA